MRPQLPGWVRGVLAVALLAVVVGYAISAVGAYRASKAPPAPSASSETTATTKPAGEQAKPAPSAPVETDGASSEEGSGEDEASSEEEDTGPFVVVKVDGLNFRTEPDKGADVIRGLHGGERLTLIETKDGWHYAEDENGERGWLYASEQYSTVEE